MIKPFNPEELVVRVNNLIEQRKRLAQKYNQKLIVQPHEIAVSSLDERFIQKIIKVVETHLDDTQLSVDMVTTELGMKAFGNADEVGAAAVDYLRVVGHLCFAYFFARMTLVALDKQDGGDPFYTAKLHTARFYFAKLLPETAGLIRSARAGVAPLLAMEESMF